MPELILAKKRQNVEIKKMILAQRKTFKQLNNACPPVATKPIMTEN